MNTVDAGRLADEVQQLRQDVRRAFRLRDSMELLDITKLARELGITRNAAEAIFRQLPKVCPPKLKKSYVRRADVERFLNEHTVAA